MICMKKILCLFITSLLIFASTTFVFADSIDRQKSFETVEEPLNSVNSLPSFEDFQLTNETINNATTNELLDKIVSCPIFELIIATDNDYTHLIGVNVLRANLNFVDSFFNRDDAYLCLSSYVSSDSEYKINAQILLNYLIYTSNEDILIDPETGLPMYPLTTPNNSTVCALKNMTYEDHNNTYLDVSSQNSILQNAYNCTIAYSISPKYNCHSFGWYQHSPNTYWINYPDVYMTDGSYVQVTTPSVGDIVTYKVGTNLSHTGVVYSIDGNNIQVISKWGCCSVFIHGLYNNFYYDYCQATNVQFWHLNVTDEEDSIGPWEYEDLSSEQLLTLLLSNLTEDNTFIISGWSLAISSNNLINIDTLNTIVNNVRSNNILLDTFLNRTDALKVIRKCISDYDVNDSNIEYSFLRYLDDYINGELTYEQGIIKAR